MNEWVFTVVTVHFQLLQETPIKAAMIVSCWVEKNVWCK